MKKVLLIVLDGWGINQNGEGNATFLARTPNLDRFYAENPATCLSASGLAVGLPRRQMGNSEVGHLTLGAGRVVYQELTRIDREIESGEFYNNQILKNAFRSAKERCSAIHLLGLLSDGGVHSHIAHLYSTLEMAKMNGVNELYIHAFMDGRDTPPKSGKRFIEELQSFIDERGIGKIATIAGRYFAMDRDNRWERIEKAYKAIVSGKGRIAECPAAAVEMAYKMGETDEFIMPTVILYNGKPCAKVKKNDGIIFFNFRADRGREITKVFIDDHFDRFDVEEKPELSFFICFTEYDKKYHLPVVFPPQDLKNILPKVLDDLGLFQFRIAETEKYAHVTFFFNGGVEKAFEGEERVLVPSPKEIPTYDMKPEMSAYAVTDAVIKRIRQERDNFILINYANGDMVGHTGILAAAIKACEAVDISLGRVVPVAEEMGWHVIITSDHGNVEQMIDYNTGEPYTAHTTNKVPFILIGDVFKGVSLRDDGGLADVAPTILEIMGIDKPDEMKGISLLRGGI